MPIWDIYSKRAKQLPDVYQFKTLPGPLRIQIQRIIHDAFTLLGLEAADPRSLRRRTIFDKIGYYM